MKKSLLYILLLVSGLFASCYPGSEEFGFEITVMTNSVKETDLDILETTVKGTYFLTSGSAEISEVGFCWAENSGYNTIPTVDHNSVVAESVKESFTAKLPKLKSGVYYALRAYVRVDEQYIYGDTQVFFTPNVYQYQPKIANAKASEIFSTSAHLSAEVTAPDEYPVKEVWFTYTTYLGDDSEKYVSVRKDAVLENGVMSADVSELTSNTHYTGYAYAANKIDTACISFSFNTGNGKPVIGEVTYKDVLATSVNLSAKVSSDASYPITEAGFEYGTNSYTYADYTRVKGIYKDGFVNLNLTGLKPETTYYIRAYAVNKKGETVSTYYNVYFKTTKIEPTFSEVKISNILLASADMSAEVTPYDAAYPIQEAGFQYYDSSYSGNVSYGSLVKGTLIGNKLTLSAIGLRQGAIYQVRTYARTSAGISYGPIKSFTTLESSDFPLVTFNGFTISANGATYISGISCSATAQVRNSSLPITEVGFVYMESYSGSSIDLDTNGAIRIKCSLSGDKYSMNLDNLTPSYNYYLVRAYALSGKEVVYNSKTVKVFTKLNNYVPSIAKLTFTKVASGVDNKVNVKLQCSAEETGGVPITEYGFVCSNTQYSPTVENNDQILKCSNGDFDGIMSLAKPNTGSIVYYIRGYAKSKYGISYSSYSSVRVYWND